MRYYWFSQQKILFSAEPVFIADSRTGFHSGHFWKYDLNPSVKAATGVILLKKVFLKILQNFSRKHLCWSLFLLQPSELQLYEKVSPTQLFSCRICEIFKNTCFEENLRTTVSETCSNFTLTFLITCTSGSNWYTCFCFCTIILQFRLIILPSLPLIMLQSGAVVRWCSAKEVFSQISRNHRKKPALKNRFWRSCRSTEFYFIKKEIPTQMFSFEFCGISSHFI